MLGGGAAANITLAGSDAAEMAQIWNQVSRAWVRRAHGALVHDFGEVFCDRAANAPFWDDATICGVVVAIVCVSFAGLLFLIALECTESRSKPRSKLVKTAIAAVMAPPVIMSLLGVALAAGQHLPPVALCEHLFGPASAEPPWPVELRTASSTLSSSMYSVFGPTAALLGPESAVATPRWVFARVWQLPSSPSLLALAQARCLVSSEQPVALAWARLAAWLGARGLQCDAVLMPGGEELTLRVWHPMFSVQHISQLITADHGSALAALADAHAAAHGWTTARHSHYATTDVPVAAMPDVVAYMRKHDIDLRIHKMVRQAFDIPWPIHTRDQFVVKYHASGQSSLDFHQDGGPGTIVSYNVLLNSPSDFVGGGTTFRAFHKSAVAISQGDAASHPSKLYHGGGVLTNGTRYILVGFAELQTPLNVLGRYVTQAGDYLAVFAPDAHAYLHRFESATFEFQIVLGVVMTALVVLSAVLFWSECQRSRAIVATRPNAWHDIKGGESQKQK